jgi:general stress protein CsbA
MKLALAILAVLLIAASLYADYKWRQWIAARKRDRQ